MEEVMEDNTSPQAEADAYYGEDGPTGEIDMSFLDEKPGA